MGFCDTNFNFLDNSSNRDSKWFFENLMVLLILETELDLHQN